MAAVAAVTIFSATGAMAEEHLKFAHWAAPNHTLQPAIIEPFSEAVSQATDGELVVDVYPGGELGKGPAEQYVRAVKGVADLVWGLPGYTSTQFPLSMIVELPGVVDEAGTGYDAIWRVYDDYLTGEYPGTVPVALWAAEPNLLIMGSKPVRSVEDMAGLKIRVSGEVAGKLIEALGATPVQMPATEMYTALQTGLIDGVLTGASAIRDFRLDEIADVYVQGPQLGNISFYVVMNERRLNRLPDNMRAAVLAGAGPALSKSGEDNWNRVADEVMAELEANPDKTVITLTPEESAPFNAITLRVRDEAIAGLDAKGLPASDVLQAMTAADK